MVTVTNQMDSLRVVSSQDILNQITKNRKNQEPSLNLQTVDQKVNEYTREDALIFAGSLGLKDTFRGVKQLVGWGEQEMEKEQRLLNRLMENPEWGDEVKAAWFAGMIVDPAGWLVPVAKARTVAKLAWHGAKWGGLAGYLGYVDEDSSDRLLQAAGGAVGGAVLSPVIGVGGRKVVDFFKGKPAAPISELGETGQEIFARRFADKAFPDEDIKISRVDDTQTVIRGQKGETIIDFTSGRSAQELLQNPQRAMREFTGSPAPRLMSPIKQFFITPFQSSTENYARFTERFLYKPVFDNPIPSIAGASGFFAGQQATEGYIQETVDRLERERDLDTGPLAAGMITLMSILSAGGAALATKKGIKTKMGGQVSEWFGRRVIDNFNLDPAIKKLKDDAFYSFNAIENQFLTIARKASTLNEDESRILYQFLDGQARNIEGKVSKEAHELGIEAQTLIRKTGQMMVDAGILDPEVYNKNLNAYIHRTYLTETLDKATGKPASEMRDQLTERAKRNAGVIGDEIRNRGRTHKFLKSETDNIEDYLNQGWERFDENRSHVILRKDYSPAERRHMGEIEDAGFAILSTAKLMLNDLSALKWYSSVNNKYGILNEESFSRLSKKEQSEYRKTGKKLFEELSPEEKVGYEKIPYGEIGKTGVSRYGVLSNVYLPKDVAGDIKIQRSISDKDNFFGNVFQSKGFKEYKKYNSLWKRTKTSWNPTVHANNLISNFVLMDLHDIGAKHLLSGLNIWTTKGQQRLNQHPLYGKVYDDLVKFGVFDASLAKVELGLGIDEFQKIYKENLKINMKDIDNVVGVSSSISGKLWDKLSKIPKGLDRRMTNTYQREDQMFRAAMYLDRLEKSMPTLRGIKKGTKEYDDKLLEIKKEAAGAAKKGFIDYNIEAPLIQGLRDTAIPFISYSYRIIPILAETATKKPHKFAKWAAVAYALNYAGNELSGSDEESERAILQEREKSQIFGLPFMPPTYLKLPDSWNMAFTFGLDKDPITGKSMPNRSLYLDTMRWIPGGDVLGQTTPGEAGGWIPGLPAPFQPSGGLLGEVMLPLTLGIDPFTGRQDDREFGINQENILFTAQRMIPNNPLIGMPVPYVTAVDSWSVQKIKKAFLQKEKASPYSEDLPVLQAIAQTMGIKLWPFERDVRVRRFSKEYQISVRKLRRRISILERDLNKYSPGTDEYYRQLDKIEEESKDMLEKQLELFNRYQRGLNK